MNARLSGVIIGAFLGAVTFASDALSQSGAPSPAASPSPVACVKADQGAHFRGDRLARRLNLTADQREKIKALREEMRAKVRSIVTQLKAKRLEQKLLWRAPTLDRSVILTKMAEIDGLRKQMREARVDFRIAMSLVLTPIQRLQFEEMGKGGRHFGRSGRPFGGGNGWRHGQKGFDRDLDGSLSDKGSF